MLIITHNITQTHDIQTFLIVVLWKRFDANHRVLTCLFQVLDADVVHREERCSGSIFGTHVSDGCSVSNRQLGDAGAEELHKLAHNSHLPQVLQATPQSTVVTNYTPQ